MNNLYRLESIDAQLLDLLQEDLPLEPDPWEKIGTQLGISGKEVLDRIRRMKRGGLIRAIAPVLEPSKAGWGASTLVGMRVPERELERIVSLINRYESVSHHYLREDGFNVWFTLAAADTVALQHDLEEIRQDAGIHRSDLLDLPVRERFKIDVRFILRGAMDQVDRKLLRALENGVPLVPEPFRQLGMSLEMSAAETIERIQRLKNEGVIRKLTARINHRNAGVVANAMVVWKVPEDQLSRIGVIMAGHPAVTHCYSRLTVPGVWDFNLYTVLHGFDREGVLALVETLSEMTEIRDYKVLFSTREFKRCSLPVPRRVQ